MKNKEYADSKGISLKRLQTEYMSFVENEGYDEYGNEYQTFDRWLDRKAIQAIPEPIDGGRGMGQGAYIADR